MANAAPDVAVWGDTVSETKSNAVEVEVEAELLDYSPDKPPATASSGSLMQEASPAAALELQAGGAETATRTSVAPDRGRPARAAAARLGAYREDSDRDNADESNDEDESDGENAYNLGNEPAEAAEIDEGGSSPLPRPLPSGFNVETKLRIAAVGSGCRVYSMTP